MSTASFTREQLLACGHGELFGPGNARLPLPNMLMFDRILSISDSGGARCRDRTARRARRPATVRG